MTDISPYSYNPTSDEYVMPEQFYPAPASDWPRRIAFAILADGIQCASHLRVGYATQRAASRLQQEARDWIASEDASYPGAFVRICEALGLEPNRIRQGVLRAGFRMPSQGLRNGHGMSPKTTTVDLLQRIALKERTKARRGR